MEFKTIGNRALVIAFHGTETNSDLVNAIAKLVADTCETGKNLHVFEFNPTDIAKIVVEKSVKEIMESEDVKDDDSSMKNALTAIGNLCNVNLNKASNSSTMRAVISALTSKPKPTRDTIAHALFTIDFIIENNKLENIEVDYSQKYGIDNSKIEVLRKLFQISKCL